MQGSDAAAAAAAAAAAQKTKIATGQHPQCRKTQQSVSTTEVQNNIPD